ncbi:MAG: hypothetical protein KGH64_00850 [Candidatus Micrarchaeota archaeon]|nr:hypothetical protein [Candidatus Micrarchaeota archaeon]MDE1833864.1 hypothetical protein [Candidatus Micrarchaeota archaeon]MDE1859351.1 hypothetical protein [Candidatus Micrarchaeota archaeon]
MHNVTTKMEYVRSFRKKTEIPEKDVEVFELFGVCLGDGHLSQYFSKYNNSFRYAVDEEWLTRGILLPKSLHSNTGS